MSYPAWRLRYASTRSSEIGQYGKIVSELIGEKTAIVMDIPPLRIYKYCLTTAVRIVNDVFIGYQE